MLQYIRVYYKVEQYVLKLNFFDIFFKFFILKNYFVSISVNKKNNIVLYFSVPAFYHSILKKIFFVS